MNYNKLKEVRTVRGMSVSELARRSGLSRVTINKLEKGGLNPTVRTVEAVCRALDKNPNDIFFNSYVNQDLHKINK